MRFVAPALFVALMSCSARRTSAPPATAPAADPSSSVPAEASEGSDGTSLGLALPRITLESGRVVLDGKVVGSADSARIQRLDALFSDLSERRGNRPDSAQPYTLTVGDDVALGQLKSVIQTAAFAGWPFATWEIDGKAVLLHATVPTPPGMTDDMKIKLHWPEKALVVVVRSDGVELWRARVGPGDHAGESVAVGSASGDAVAPLFERQCASDAGGCSPSAWMVDNPTSARTVKKLFREIRSADWKRDSPLLIDLQVREPEARGAPPPIRLINEATNPRIPPEKIQATIRASYSKFRACYDQGLGRNPKLEGRVVARFTIARDGTVSEVNRGDGTTLPDAQVVDCILSLYKMLVFPKPEEGTVTVVYPIHFSPE